MGLLARFLDRPQPALSTPPSVRPDDAMRDQTRRELVSMALRDTLKKYGIAAGCITAEALPSVSAARQRGLHLQLVFREWNPHLLGYVVALEAMVRSRLLRLDPLSAGWVVGMSWKFAPLDASKWPQLPALGPLYRHEPASGPAPDTAAGMLRQLLGPGDASHARRAARSGDFSPTLPM